MSRVMSRVLSYSTKMAGASPTRNQYLPARRRKFRQVMTRSLETSSDGIYLFLSVVPRCSWVLGTVEAVKVIIKMMYDEKCIAPLVFRVVRGNASFICYQSKRLGLTGFYLTTFLLCCFIMTYSMKECKE